MLSIWTIRRWETIKVSVSETERQWAYKIRLRYSPILIDGKIEGFIDHEVKLNLELNDVRNAYWAATTSDSGATWTTALSAVSVGALASASLFVDYIYLDTDERRRFAQVSHEYLIEQLQFTGDESTSNTNNKIKLNFEIGVEKQPAKTVRGIISQLLVC